MANVHLSDLVSFPTPLLIKISHFGLFYRWTVSIHVREQCTFPTRTRVKKNFTELTTVVGSLFPEIVTLGVLSGTETSHIPLTIVDHHLLLACHDIVMSYYKPYCL